MESIFIKAKYFKTLIKKFKNIEDSIFMTVLVHLTCVINKCYIIKNVNKKLYGIMIGYLLFPTASRPYPMFIICLSDLK